MSKKSDDQSPKSSGEEDKKTRLAQALRANLRRRKDQARARNTADREDGADN